MKISGSATFSECRRYRYSLSRVWEWSDFQAVFVGLNPSTADESNDDPTIRRCIGFAKDWGFGGILMLNLFAFRATKPEDMKLADDPVGPDNDKTLRHWLDQYQGLACWGNHGSHLNRGIEIIPDAGF